MSYAYSKAGMFDKILPLLTRENVLLIDSGAFTLWTKGRQVDIKEYAAFCKRILSMCPCEAWVINLDVIPGKFGIKPTEADRHESARQGWENYQYLKALGLPVIHVFHMYEDLDWLHKLKESADYIGISPANDASVKDRMKWLRQVFSIIKTDVRAHSFGFTALGALTAFPFFSADSSSWVVSQRYGITNVYKDFKMSAVRKQDAKKLHMRGLDGETMYHDKYARTEVNIHSVLKAESDITRLWEARGIKWPADPQGF